MYSIIQLLRAFGSSCYLSVDDCVELLLKEQRNNVLSFEELVVHVYNAFNSNIVDNNPGIHALFVAKIFSALLMRADKSITPEKQMQLQDNMLKQIRQSLYLHRATPDSQEYLRTVAILRELAKVSGSNRMFAAEILELLFFHHTNSQTHDDVFIELAKCNVDLHQDMIRCLFQTMRLKNYSRGDYKNSLLIQLVAKQYLDAKSVFSFCKEYMPTANEKKSLSRGEKIIAINLLGALVHVAPQHDEEVLTLLMKAAKLNRDVMETVDSVTLSLAKVDGLSIVVAEKLLKSFIQATVDHQHNLTIPINNSTFEALGHLAISAPKLGQRILDTLRLYPINDAWMDVAKINPDLRAKVLENVAARDNELCVSPLKCAELACVAPEVARTMFEMLHATWDNLNTASTVAGITSWNTLRKFIKSDAVRKDIRLQQDVFQVITDVIHAIAVNNEVKEELCRCLEEFIPLAPDAYNDIYLLVKELIADPSYQVRVNACYVLAALAKQATGTRGVEMVEFIETILTANLPIELNSMLNGLGNAMLSMTMLNREHAEYGEKIASVLARIQNLNMRLYNTKLWETAVAWFEGLEVLSDSAKHFFANRLREADDEELGLLYSKLRGEAHATLTNENMNWLQAEVQAMKDPYQQSVHNRAILLALLTEELRDIRSERVVATNYLQSQLSVDPTHHAMQFFYRKPIVIVNNEKVETVAPTCNLATG